MPLKPYIPEHSPHTPPQDLQAEIASLKAGVAGQTAGSGSPRMAQSLSLALNSLQRLHASQLQLESEEEEEADEADDDDGDDPFYMPMLPSAVKMADVHDHRWLGAARCSEALNPTNPKHGYPQ